MQATDLTGTYTYRSFLDRPEPVDDFNKLRFAQLELRLTATPTGSLSGLLVFSADEDPLAMDMVGQSSGDGPLTFTLTGRGKPGTSIADFHYEYDGVVLRHWEAGIGQRMTLAGTVLRAEDHGTGPGLARAGQTASFLAVKRTP
ncbi:hypothetical protein [Streptomyces sp. NBC_00893]|uniref:hypothetical protein n=1 Tax=Streptomyces sp. NBC_00893 TaxID=2975862 RepID=UPI0022578EF4|nr:hypothetical protein [Streptomyces sp. NBC_00893]MCX4843996.1 hypothetical protein [Streptomyces sp. NBC_00893]